MESQGKPTDIRKAIMAYAMVVVILLVSVNCNFGEMLVNEVNEDRTATAKAIDTEWAKTSTEEAKRHNNKTAIADKATLDARFATQRAEMRTEIAHKNEITETARAPKPPVITGISFPGEIPGNKSIMIGLLYFTDMDGDVQYVTYDVVRATNFTGGNEDDLKLDSGNWNNGAIKIYLWCDGQQKVTLMATLHDQAGNRSNSMSFSFTCK